MRRLLVAALVCIVGCAVVLAVGGSSLMTFIGIALGGIAFVLLISAAFYAIGRSEDRERAEREQRLSDAPD
jgi:FtsH-binding integral membrane protein